MAQWARVPVATPDGLHAVLGNHMMGREPTPESCSLTFAHMLWYVSIHTGACMHTHTKKS